MERCVGDYLIRGGVPGPRGSSLLLRDPQPRVDKVLGKAGSDLRRHWSRTGSNPRCLFLRRASKSAPKPRRDLLLAFGFSRFVDSGNADVRGSDAASPPPLDSELLVFLCNSLPAPPRSQCLQKGVRKLKNGTLPFFILCLMIIDIVQEDFLSLLFICVGITATDSRKLN